METRLPSKKKKATTTASAHASLDTNKKAKNNNSSEIQNNFELKGIEWLQDNVVSVLNELYDPAEVARGNVLAKFSKGKKKKKAKNGDAPIEPEMTESEKQALSDEAAAQAKPFTRKDAMVTPETHGHRLFGDYQVNAAMGLANALGMSPVACANQIVDGLKPRIGSLMDEIKITGPGFVNLRFQSSYLEKAVQAMVADASGRLAIPKTPNPQRIVVDFSSPNIAKEMHVGHLRSTIIGDTLCNLLEFLGHDVLRLNHVGDWGTQVGMVVEHLRDEYPSALDRESAESVDVGDLDVLYKAAKKRFDEDDDFKTRARQNVVKLQSGNPEEVAAWEALCAASRIEYQKIYDLLDIKGLEERGESYYNKYLNDVVVELKRLGLATESDGAKVVIVDGYTNRDGSPFPMIIQKSDGGFNYATTDLAAVRHRSMIPKEESGEQADRVLYVTDAGQANHFEMVFQVAKKAGFCSENTSLEHVPCGLVQGEDGKNLAIRSEDTVKDLLTEAVRIAGKDLLKRNKNHDEAFLDRVDRVSRIVGVGTFKYANLSMNRESNYKLTDSRMLSFDGNKAQYIMYAYARICGIVRKASGQEESDPVVWPEPAKIIVSDYTEEHLMRKLVVLPDVLSNVERHLCPNTICDYLFEISQKFNLFYEDCEDCSVNNAETPELKASRLSLCTATAGTIRLLLRILGIQVVEKL
ncbi:hypothetical protein ACA910_001591 [Epithemia clementina (nom. ined.)]